MTEQPKEGPFRVKNPDRFRKQYDAFVRGIEGLALTSGPIGKLSNLKDEPKSPDDTLMISHEGSLRELLEVQAKDSLKLNESSIIQMAALEDELRQPIILDT